MKKQTPWGKTSPLVSQRFSGFLYGLLLFLLLLLSSPRFVPILPTVGQPLAGGGRGEPGERRGILWTVEGK